MGSLVPMEAHTVFGCILQAMKSLAGAWLQDGGNEMNILASTRRTLLRVSGFSVLASMNTVENCTVDSEGRDRICPLCLQQLWLHVSVHFSLMACFHDHCTSVVDLCYMPDDVWRTF